MLWVSFSTLTLSGGRNGRSGSHKIPTRMSPAGDFNYRLITSNVLLEKVAEGIRRRTGKARFGWKAAVKMETMAGLQLKEIQSSIESSQVTKRKHEAEPSGDVFRNSSKGAPPSSVQFTMFTAYS